MAEVFVEVDGNGRLVVRKVATSPRDDVASEAGWLGRAAGPGVAGLVAVDPDGRWLTTAHAGAHTWRTARPAPPEAARLTAAVLRTLARLHQQGLVHGAVGPDHILIGPSGPVLCSPQGSAVDPEVDRRAVVDLLAASRQRWDADGISIPRTSPWPRAVDLLQRSGSGWTLDQVADLLDLRPEPAMGEPRDATPPARRSGRAWAGLAFGRGRVPRSATATTRPAGQAPTEQRPARHRGVGSRPPGRAAGIALAAVGLAAVAVVGGLVLRPAPVDGGPPPADAPAASEPPSGPVPHEPVATNDPAPAGPDRPPGATATATATGYRTDQAGNVVATAARPCPGTPPAAALEPETGTVWAYPSLPGSGERMAGVAVQRTPGASDLDVRNEDGCDRIVVVGPAGEAAVPAAAGSS